MIQDIEPKHLDNHYENKSPRPQDAALCFSPAGEVFCRAAADGSLEFPRFDALPEGTAASYLFAIDDERYFLIPEGTPLPEGFSTRSLRQLRRLRPMADDRVYAAYTGYHLWKWYRSSRYCGACGAATVPDETERMLRCPVCGNQIYPRLNPAVIVGVLGGGRILVTRYRTGFAHNALVAGFTEIGETLEQTVAREVFEETGLHVKNIRYYKSQPWGVAQDILMGFFCEVDGDARIRMDEHELKYAAWETPETLELQPSDHSLTNEMMRLFKQGKVR